MEKITESDVHDFVKRRSCVILATAREESAPDLAHAFVYTDVAFTGYFLSKIETRKIDNISKNPHVSVMFSDRDSLQQVEYLANAKIIDDTKQIVAILPKIQDIISESRSEYWVPPVTQVPGSGYCIVELTPMSVTYRDYSREEKDAGAHEFKVKL